MIRPWLLQLGPLVIPTEAREELNALSTGLSRDEYVKKVWEMRVEEMPPAKRARSRAWPKTFRTAGKGFVLLPKAVASNVHTIERKRKP